MPEITNVILNSCHGKKAIRHLRSRKSSVILLGSAASIWSDTNIPSGIALSKRFSSFLTEPIKDSSIRKNTQNLIERTAFEHILWRLPNRDVFSQAFSIHFENAPPNPIHFAIAELIKQGVIKHVITTNYDTALEKALKIALSPSYSR